MLHQKQIQILEVPVAALLSWRRVAFLAKIRTWGEALFELTRVEEEEVGL